MISKALIRHLGAEPARVHEVSAQLAEVQSRLTPEHHPELMNLIAISRELRRDSELAFYGTEDLTPSEFYSRADAERAFNHAQTAVSFVAAVVGPLEC